MFLNQAKGRARGENTAIQRRREKEDQRNAFQTDIDRDWKQRHKAEWEIKTSAQMERNQITNIARGLQKEDQKSLQGRRVELRRLLMADDEVYRQELGRLHETSADKAKRMVKYARELKAQREDRRKAFAKEMYARRWRASCDDLRTIDSNQFMKHCMAEVGVQRQERVITREKARTEEEMWAATWTEDRKKKVAREEGEAMDRKAFNHETKIALLQQMDDSRKKKEDLEKIQSQERATFQEKMERDLAAATQTAKEKAVWKRQEQREVMEFNDRILAQKKMEEERRENEDKKDLEQKMEEHQHENARKAEAKTQMRADMAAYRTYLDRRESEAAEMEKEMERLTFEEMQRANQKRDMQWMREDLARKQLMKDVYDGRVVQIKERASSRQQRSLDLQAEREALHRETHKARALAEQEDIQLRRKEEERRRDLKKQMQNNRNMRKIEEARIVADREEHEEGERRYRSFLEREKTNAQNTSFEKKNYGKRNVDFMG